MKIVIESGFFNPLHGGHLDMIEAGAKLGDKLIVIVNNDAQQVLKKGKVILTAENRARLLVRYVMLTKYLLLSMMTQQLLSRLKLLLKNIQMTS